METSAREWAHKPVYKVLILPMRNGNQFLKPHLLPHFCVLILPMRNGNFICFNFCSFTYFRSYPTYEEWKQSILKLIWYIKWLFLSYLWGMETQRILLQLWNHLWFLSYLWGMETVLVYIRQIYPSLPVLILPMRNGNSSSTSHDTIVFKRVLILPMRNKKQRDAHIARLYNLIINNGYNMFL